MQPFMCSSRVHNRREQGSDDKPRPFWPCGARGIAARLFGKGVAYVERGPAPLLQMDVSWDGVVATVTVAGELDAATAPGLTGRLMSLAEARPERLVLDLGGLVFVDVAGVRALDGARETLEAQCPVIFRRPRPSARRSFLLTGRWQG